MVEKIVLDNPLSLGMGDLGGWGQTGCSSEHLPLYEGVLNGVRGGRVLLNLASALNLAEEPTCGAKAQIYFFSSFFT